MAFLGQYWAIFCTFIKLKRCRFLWLLIFGISAMSNHVLYKVVGSWVVNFGMQSYSLIGGDDFADNNVIVGNIKQHENEFSVLTSLINEQRIRAGNKYTIEDCSQSKEKDACSMQLLSLMVSQSANKFSHHVEFSANRSNTRIICNIAYGSETYCPFLASLVSTASYGVQDASYRFKNITTFRYVPIEKPSLKARSNSASMCARDPEYLTVMPRTVLVQTFLLLCSVFIYLLASTVPCIVDLKGRDFLQLLFRRGLSVSAYWLAVWTVTLIELLLVAVLLAASHALQCPGFYETNRLSRLVLVFAVHTCAIASLIFLLTVVMQKQFVIGMATLLLASACCVVLALSLILLHWLRGFSWARFALLALPPGLLGEQLQAILVSQLRAEAETEFHTTALILGGCTLAGSLLLTLYLDFVLSSGNGLFLRTPHFPCAMLCGHKRRQLEEERPERAQSTVESVHGLRPVLQIRNLSKEFVSCTDRGNTVALKNVSATLYENQLTAFVGHNGSGKSALFNILAGKTLASSGNVLLSGYDLSHAKNRYSLAPSIGICYQHDALCGRITVADSIGLVLSACNAAASAIHEAELDHILTQLGLKEKLGLRVCNLSTGQKRKLCTTLALIGNPNLIILDEPTSNLDPVSRRQLWKLLQEYRLDRCIVLTTSLMEEADVLADRKIFLSGGSVICAGSSLFLRRAFDCGFIFQTRVKTERHVGWVLRDVNRRFPTVRARSIYRSNIELEVSPLEDRLLPGVAEALEKLPDLVDSFELEQHSLEQIFSRLRSMPLKDVERLFKSGEIGYTITDPLDTQQQQERQSAVLSPTWSQSVSKLAPSLQQRILAMAAIYCVRIRRKRSAIFSRIVFPGLLLLLLICSLVGERMARSRQLKIWVSLQSSRGGNFTKGLCIDDSDLPGHRHIPHNFMCKELLAPQLNKSAENYVFTSKMKNISVFAHFAGVVNNMREFQRQCSQIRAEYEPCPLIYASNWCEDNVTNSERVMAIGFYSLYDYFNIELAIEYLLRIYQKALLRYNSVLAKNVVMEVEVIGVKEFRTTFLPLLGLFFQIIILCIVPATYLDDLMEDKASGVRNQLKALGMSSGHYWICIFVAHWIQYSIVYILSTVLLCAVLPGSYFSSSFLFCIFLPTLVLGLASNQLSAYFISTIFDRQNAVLTVVYSIFSVIIGLSLLLAQLDNRAGLVLICLFPPVASVALTFYGGKLIVYALAFMKVESVTELADPLGLLFMSLHIKIALIAMLAHIALLCLAIFIMEKRRTMKCCCCSNQYDADKGPAFVPSEDAGVQEETARLDQRQRDQLNLLEVRHLRILASSGERIIRDVSFAVRRGEIFGLLGPNGSGKTSLVSAIAGDLRTHGGTCEVSGPGNLWLPSHVAASGGKIGYCQSSDPLLSHVTVEEHLKFYATVLGVSSEKCQALVQELLKTFHLEESKDKMTFQISNGCKRRLSMAISLLGDPSIVAIDDPSEGVDPEGRRLIWAAIRSIASENRAVVVTMQTMDEVNSLCTRVGIMNHGLLVGIGTMEQILNRYGQIYTLSIQLEEDMSECGELRQAMLDSVLKAVHAKFPDAFVVEQMAASALVCVPFSNIDRLSGVLKWLVDNKNSFGISIFSLRRVYLDEIFQLIIKSHDDKLLKRKYSIFSMAEALPLNQLGDSTQAPSSVDA